jgi:hypothetical protein
MEKSANYETRLSFLETQLTEQEAICKAKKDHLDEVQAEALQKQFDLTKLNHPTFFQRHFGNLRKRKDEAWAVYQEAVLQVEQAKLDLEEQKSRMSQLQSEYQAIIAGK